MRIAGFVLDLHRHHIVFTFRNGGIMSQAIAAHKLEEIWTEPWEWTYEDYLNLPEFSGKEMIRSMLLPGLEFIAAV